MPVTDTWEGVMAGIGKDLVIGVDLDGVCADFYEPMRGLVADWRCVDVHELTRKVSHGLRQWGVPEAPTIHLLLSP